MKSNEWYLDSACSRHMTGDSSKFASMKPRKGGHVTFGDNSKGEIIGIGNIGKCSSHCIEDVLLVKNLKHNLISISQLCDRGNRVIFEPTHCIVENLSDKKPLFIGPRQENVYVLNLENLPSSSLSCLSAINNDAWLWHRRLGHAKMDLISRILKKDLVKGLPKIKFEKDRICDACQKGN